MRYCRFLFVFLLLPLLYSCGNASANPGTVTQVNGADSAVVYMGRVLKTAAGTEMFWSGTSATLRFVGNGVDIKLRDETGKNYYYCIIDGQIVKTIHADSGDGTYTFNNLKADTHSVTLFRLTEESAGKTILMKWVVSGTVLQPMQLPTRSIQFYGNSITAGYSVDDTTGDSKDPQYFNNYYTYAAITARHYNARYTNISKSGIGIMLSWFPVIMPEMYDRIIPNDSNSHFDYSNDKTNIVVIDLFQNDSWLVNKPGHAQFKARFGTTAPTPAQIVAAYKSFVQTIRRCHPRAHIICTLGSMDATKDGSPWPGYITQAVKQLGDKKIYTCFFPYKGTPGHPKRKEQQAMADILIRFIDKKIKW